MDRRSWMKLGGAVCATTAALPFVFQRRTHASRAASLVSDPKHILDLRGGLAYRVLERAFDPMSDGHRVPARPDGMACFVGKAGTWILMRNHELDYNLALSAYRRGPVAEAYDPRAAGGVTRLVIDAKTGDRISSNLVLAGTLRNCAGGPSPWGWISCEETTIARHGYAFLCSVEAEQVQPAHSLPGYGRFRHEAAAVDPRSLVAYLTEDQPDGCVYRFVPKTPSTPFEGQLQALRHASRKGFALSSMNPGERIPVSWVNVDDPEPKTDDVRYQAAARGAASLSRGEGIWFANDSVWICSTNGGRAQRGQIFVLEQAPDGKQSLRLVVESMGEHHLDMPDNITVAPWGDVIVAEDGLGEQYLRGITPRGEVYDLARNAGSQGEFAGVCFSPDGSTLFANMQIDGLTVAITGRFPGSPQG